MRVNWLSIIAYLLLDNHSIQIHVCIILNFFSKSIMITILDFVGHLFKVLAFLNMKVKKLP